MSSGDMSDIIWLMSLKKRFIIDCFNCSNSSSYF